MDMKQWGLGLNALFRISMDSASFPSDGASPNENQKRIEIDWDRKNCNICVFLFPLKEQSHKKVGEIRVWDGIGPN
jgi:hypothetical protein